MNILYEYYSLCENIIWLKQHDDDNYFDRTHIRSQLAGKFRDEIERRWEGELRPANKYFSKITSPR